MSKEYEKGVSGSGLTVEDGLRAVEEAALIMKEYREKKGFVYTFKEKISDWGVFNTLVTATTLVAAEYLMFGNYLPNTLKLLSEGRYEEAVSSMFMGGVTLGILGTVIWASAVKKIF